MGNAFVGVKDGRQRRVTILDQVLDGHSEPEIAALPREVLFDQVNFASEEMAWSLDFTIIRDDEVIEMEAEFKNGVFKVKHTERCRND